MQFSAVLSLALVGTVAAHAPWVKSLTEYTNDIPQCAVNAVRIGMKNQGCNLNKVDARDFDCICDNYGDIDGRVYYEVEPSCAADWSRAAGVLCGAWAVESTTASDLAQATQALGSKLGINSQAQATPVSNASVPAKEAVKEAAPAKNSAPIPTGRIARSFGGAAVADAAMHL